MNTNWFVRNDDEGSRLREIEALAVGFAKRAPKHDDEGSFPHENIADLRHSGYVTWTVPKKFGGKEISLYEMLLHQEAIARGDGSTALAIGWHIGMMLSLRSTGAFPEPLFGEVCKSIVEHGALINSCATEPATGSPSRGGRPETTAREVEGGYRITGRKTFSSLSPALDWILVTAGLEGAPQVGEFIVRGTDVEIIETWNVMGMRATGSHDIVLTDVFVPNAHVVTIKQPGEKSQRNADGGGWMLHIPACYLGIALNARDVAMEYAATYQPNSLPHPISEVPHVQQKLGQMEAKLLTARTLMYDLARRWDEMSLEERPQLRSELGVAKVIATNTAVEVVDLSMRIVGGRSLSRDFVLERLYRDVRAGLHNPPMEDVVWQTLARAGTAPYRKG